jgi:hypothetical protein
MVIRVNRKSASRGHRPKRRVAAAKIGTKELGQVVDVRAGVREGIAVYESMLKSDDLTQRKEPPRVLDDLPALVIAEACFQNIEV